MVVWGLESRGREQCRLVMVLHIRCGSSAAVDGAHGHVRFPAVERDSVRGWRGVLHLNAPRPGMDLL